MNIQRDKQYCFPEKNKGYHSRNLFYILMTVGKFYKAYISVFPFVVWRSEIKQQHKASRKFTIRRYKQSMRNSTKLPFPDIGTRTCRHISYINAHTP